MIWGISRSREDFSRMLDLAMMGQPYVGLPWL